MKYWRMKMNKLQKKAQSSKLNITKKKQEKVININRKATYKFRSFYFDTASDNDLKELLEKVNSLSRKKISAGHLIRALVYLGKKTKEDRLLKALKEVT